MPFNEIEQGEIRELCSIKFYEHSSMPENYDPVIERKYSAFFQVFWICINNKTDFALLPEMGGVLEQPVKTMGVLQVMRDVLLNKKYEEMKEMKNKMNR